MNLDLQFQLTIRYESCDHNLIFYFYFQALIEKLADFEPALVERVIASLPLTSIDPHRASVLTRERGLWQAVGAIAAALGNSKLPALDYTILDNIHVLPLNHLSVTKSSRWFLNDCL